MTLLITGASGFIGRHLCARLTIQNRRILVLLRRPEQLPQLREQVQSLGGKPHLIEAIRGDLDRPECGLSAPLPPLDAIIHLGARFAWGLSTENAKRTNVAGSLAVARLAKAQRCRLVFISGFMLENKAHLQRLGIDWHRPEHTSWPAVYRRAGGYEASKLEAAFKVRAFAARRALDFVEVQPATVAGDSVSGELDAAQPLYALLDNLARGRLALVPGSPRHWLPLVAVDHLGALIARAALAQTPPSRLLALDERTPNLRGLLALAAPALGRTPPRHHLPLPLLSALLRIPGLAKAMATDPEALHFIQTTRFDTTVTRAFTASEGLTAPAIDVAIERSAQYYRQHHIAAGRGRRLGTTSGQPTTPP